MKLYGQIAAWDEGFAVALDDAALRWLDGKETDRHISIVTEGRRIMVCPDTESDPSVRRRVYKCGTGSHVDYRHRAVFNWDSVQGDDLPRFALYETELKMGNDDCFLWADLPDDHMLPWPKLRDCASYSVPDQIVRDLEKRMASARDANSNLPPAKWQWEPMPKKYRDMLASGVYGDVLRSVIARVPYGAKVAA